MSRKLLIVEMEMPADFAVYRSALSAMSSEIEIVTATDIEEALALAPDAEILVMKGHVVTQALVDGLKNLAWLQVLTSGTDRIEALALPDDLAISSVRGVHGPQMSELAILLMLALLRDLRQTLIDQQQHLWARRRQRLLQGRLALLVGVGAIGEALAQRLSALGMRVEGISDGRAAVPEFAAIHPRAALAERVASADFVIVLAPYSAATHHLIDAASLRAMRSDAFLINLARGKVADEQAILTALSEGWIAGAALDVFETEPLPPDSPLWSAPNLIITPHIGGLSDCYAEQCAPVLAHNVRAYLDGTPERMTNLVRGPRRSN